MIEKRVKLEVEGQKLVGILCLPEGEGPFPGVVCYHGRGSSRAKYTSLCQKLAENGIIGFCFDFRGHGESEGEFTKLSLVDGEKDALVAFDFLKSLKMTDSARIGICGSSMGAYLAAIVSSKKDVFSLVLRAPAVYALEAQNISLSQVFTRGFLESGDLRRVESILAIRKFMGNLLIVRGEKDEQIPKRVVDAYFKNAQNAKEKKLYTIKDATHALTDLPWQEELKRIVCGWFKKTLQ
jgi:dienelactone hydrolase